MFASNKSI